MCGVSCIVFDNRKEIIIRLELFSNVNNLIMKLIKLFHHLLYIYIILSEKLSGQLQCTEWG